MKEVTKVTLESKPIPNSTKSATFCHVMTNNDIYNFINISYITTQTNVHRQIKSKKIIYKYRTDYFIYINKKYYLLYSFNFPSNSQKSKILGNINHNRKKIKKWIINFTTGNKKIKRITNVYNKNGVTRHDLEAIKA